jgi:hypothetical protein
MVYSALSRVSVGHHFGESPATLKFPPGTGSRVRLRVQSSGKVLNKRLPLLRIDIVLAEDKVTANMGFESPNLNRSSASKFVQSRFPLERVNVADGRLQLYRALLHYVI